MRPTECVFDGDVDLGAIESAVTRIETPFARVRPLENGGELLICRKSVPSITGRTYCKPFQLPPMSPACQGTYLVE